VRFELEEQKITLGFDTGSGTYPSISGMHKGTIKPNHTVIATKLYTYPCEGTGRHTEYARIWNKTWNATATWDGYADDWHKPCCSFTQQNIQLHHPHRLLICRFTTIGL